MKIKLSDFGARVAPTATSAVRRERVDFQPEPAARGTVPVDIPAGAFVSSSNLGDKAMAAAATMLREERAEERQAQRDAEVLARQEAREAKQNEELARRNRMASSFAAYQVDLDELSTGISSRLVEGQIGKDDAKKELEEGIKRLRAAHVETLDPTSQATLADNLIRFDGKANAKFETAVRQVVKKERIDGFNSAIESLQRLALTDREGATRQAEVMFKGEGVALFGADKAGKAFQQFKEQTTFVDIDRRITANEMNAKGLSTLKAELASDAFADLAPERRNYLEGKIERNLLNIEHRGEIAERRRLSNLDIQQRRLTWYVENGREIPPAEFSAFVRASKGTPFEGFAATLVSEQKAVSELAGMAPDRMIARIKEIEAGYGATPTKEQISHLDKLKRFADRSIKQLTESPLTYAVEREGAKLVPLDMTNAGSWAANLQARTAVLTEQSKRTGVAPKGLFPQEVAALTNMIKTAPVEQKREILASLRQGFGDDRVFKATMAQIAPDDPVIAAAGLAAGRGLESQKDRFLADELLRGQALLRPNKKEDGKPGGGSIVKMPSDADLVKLYATRTRDAFANNSEAGDLFFQQAKAVYAARTDAAGDMSGVINASRWDESINAVAQIEKHRGRHVVLPYNMSYGQFRDSLAIRLENLVASGALEEKWTADKLADLPLQNAGDGRYIFRVGDGKLVDKNRRDVVIDFNERLPFRPSGHR